MSKFGIEKRVNRSAFNNSSSSSRNTHLFKASANVWEVFVPYQKGFTLFKVLPGLNPEDGGDTLDPMILPDGSFGSWQTSAPVVVCGKGEQQVTFCALTDFYHPTSVNQTPYYLAYNMVNRMSKLPSNDLNRVDSWVNLLYGTGANDPAVMPKPTDHTFVAVINLSTSKGQDVVERALNQLHILHLKTAATRALRDAVNSCSASGIDITDFQNGPLVSIWSGVADDPWTSAPGNKDSRQYNYRLLDSIPNSSTTKDFSQYAARFKDMLLPWSHILYCPSMEEQARWCMEALPPDLLFQAWKDPMGSFYPFVTDDMANQLNEGCRLKWERENARQAAQQARFARVETPAQAPQQMFRPAPQQQQNFVINTQPAQPVQQPVQSQNPTQQNVGPTPRVDISSSIPGLIPPSARSYSPVPDQFKDMLSKNIPFDADNPDIEKL